MKTAVVGGGAAGFFLAINLKELCPEMEVTIFEKSKKVLAKVEVSGGGRCNCTNSFASVRDLSQVYPRGHRLMKRLFNCKVAMYTCNSKTFFAEHLGKEIDLVYTDNWNPLTQTNNDTLYTTAY